MASETIEVSGRQIELRRQPYKRSIGITLQVNGRVKVSAPKSTPLAMIVKYVESQTEWINQHLAKYESIRASYPRKQVKAGERLPYLGRELTLVFEPALKQKPTVSIRGDELVIAIPCSKWAQFDASAEHAELMPLVLRFYQTASREILSERLSFFVRQMDLHPSGVSFRSQKTRWGSCSSRGRISLNWRLVVAPLDVIDYVVVHELSHLKVYNHSEVFWRLVETQIPDARIRREWLRENAYVSDFLSARSELHA